MFEVSPLCESIPCAIEHHPNIIVGGIYRHYKGHEYRVLAISRNADDETVWVVYECVYDNPVSQIWHRKLDEFVQIGLFIPGKPPCARFELVPDTNHDGR